MAGGLTKCPGCGAWHSGVHRPPEGEWPYYLSVWCSSCSWPRVRAQHADPPPAEDVPALRRWERIHIDAGRLAPVEQKEDDGLW